MHKHRSTSSLLERRGSIMGARNLFSSSSSSSSREPGTHGAAEVEKQLQRPRTSAGAAEASPTKSRFSRLRYHRNRKTTTAAAPTETERTPVVERQENQLRQRHQSTLGQLPEGAFLDFDDDASDSESRPSTSSSVASSVKSSGGWSWSMRGRRSSVSLRERWRASSISSSSSTLSSSSSFSSASSYISSASSSSSSTWDSLDSTPRASIASSRTSYSSDEEAAPPQKTDSGKLRPTKTVRAYVCRHFVSIPIPEEEEPDTASTSDAIPPSENQHVQKDQQFQGPQPLPTPSPDENEDCITDPMADAFDINDHLPPPHILRPWAEPTPPPTPPLQAKQLQLPSPSPPQLDTLQVPQSPPPVPGVPTFTITPASPIQPTGRSPFSSSPPIAPHRSFSAPVVGGPIVVPANAPRRRSTTISSSNAPSSLGQTNKVEKGTPAMCPTCVKLQESMAQMRKVAGIYGPRHSLTVAAAKTARAARVAWAGAQWEASCVWEDDCGGDEAVVKSRKEGLAKEEKKQKKVVSFQPSATFFVDREPFIEPPQPKPSTAEGGDIASDEEDEKPDAEAQLQREMIIGQRLWGPLGERGRKQRDFKRSMSESYVAGRWAPPGRNGEWLDTSGRTQTYEEFWAADKHHAKAKDGGSHGAASVLGGKVIRGVLGKFVPGAGAHAAAKKERERFERAERLERVVGLEVD
ncbi:uncharacterized protein BKCO1_6000219 [Diplodia corticola]|uniref:Uncharacterized protein n=1 Tax=Diplodia corticola TaxID=236234 RepID=A0A1J9SB45_9PEZI|nr:uncharacterized protein BKCO1_6000219 [Diplodia corticola]OJD37711.1 hypothetical protein BKCO1_6000219 [Diplodia corticola]